MSRVVPVPAGANGPTPAMGVSSKPVAGPAQLTLDLTGKPATGKKVALQQRIAESGAVATQLMSDTLLGTDLDLSRSMAQVYGDPSLRTSLRASTLGYDYGGDPIIQDTNVQQIVKVMNGMKRVKGGFTGMDRLMARLRPGNLVVTSIKIGDAAKLFQAQQKFETTDRSRLPAYASISNRLRTENGDFSKLYFGKRSETYIRDLQWLNKLDTAGAAAHKWSLDQLTTGKVNIPVLTQSSTGAASGTSSSTGGRMRGLVPTRSRLKPLTRSKAALTHDNNLYMQVVVDGDAFDANIFTLSNSIRLPDASEKAIEGLAVSPLFSVSANINRFYGLVIRGGYKRKTGTDKEHFCAMGSDQHIDDYETQVSGGKIDLTSEAVFVMLVMMGIGTVYDWNEARIAANTGEILLLAKVMQQTELFNPVQSLRGSVSATIAKLSLIVDEGDTVGNRVEKKTDSYLVGLTVAGQAQFAKTKGNRDKLISAPINDLCLYTITEDGGAISGGRNDNLGARLTMTATTRKKDGKIVKRCTKGAGENVQWMPYKGAAGYNKTMTRIISSNDNSQKNFASHLKGAAIGTAARAYVNAQSNEDKGYRRNNTGTASVYFTKDGQDKARQEAIIQKMRDAGLTSVPEYVSAISRGTLTAAPVTAGGDGTGSAIVARRSPPRMDIDESESGRGAEEFKTGADEGVVAGAGAGSVVAGAGADSVVARFAESEDTTNAVLQARQTALQTLASELMAQARAVQSPTPVMSSAISTLTQNLNKLRTAFKTYENTTKPKKKEEAKQKVFEAEAQVTAVGQQLYQQLSALQGSSAISLSKELTTEFKRRPADDDVPDPSRGSLTTGPARRRTDTEEGFVSTTRSDNEGGRFSLRELATHRAAAMYGGRGMYAASSAARRTKSPAARRKTPAAAARATKSKARRPTRSPARRRSGRTPALKTRSRKKRAAKSKTPAPRRR